MAGSTTQSADVCCEVAARTAGRYRPSREVGVPKPPLRVLRESFPGEPRLDIAVARALLARASGEAESLRLHRTGRVLAFGPQDRLAPGYATARAAAEERGFVPVERLAGGRAAVYHEGTIALAWTIRDREARQHIRQHFETAARLIADALRSLGVDARVGPVPGEYCPGAYSVNAGGRTKLAGIAQRVASGATHIGAVVVVSGSPAIRDVLTPVYAALGLEWDPATVGCIEDEIAGSRFDDVVDAITASFAQKYALTEATLDDVILKAARELAASGGAALR